MSRTQVFAARIGDGGLLDGIRELFGSEALQDFITGLLENWITTCAIPASGRDAKRQAEEEYEGEYNRRFLRRATRSVQRERRLKRLPRLTSHNAEQVAIVVLDAVRRGDEEEMTLAIHDC